MKITEHTHTSQQKEARNKGFLSKRDQKLIQTIDELNSSGASFLNIQLSYYFKYDTTEVSQRRFSQLLELSERQTKRIAARSHRDSLVFKHNRGYKVTNISKVNGDLPRLLKRHAHVIPRLAVKLPVLDHYEITTHFSPRFNNGTLFPVLRENTNVPLSYKEYSLLVKWSHKQAPFTRFSEFCNFFPAAAGGSSDTTPSC